MDAIALLVGAGYALMAGAVGLAAVYGSPRAKDRAHDREQAERQQQIDKLEQLLHESQFTAGLRTAPVDTSTLEARIERLKAEKHRASDFESLPTRNP